MSESDRPPLGAYAYEKIAKKCHEIETSFWKSLSDLRIETPFSLLGPTPATPSHPQMPEHLRSTIIQYAGAMFRFESDEYPASPDLDRWLTNLSERVVDRVMKAVDTMDQASFDVMFSKQYSGLSWHGLTRDEMRAAAFEGTNSDKAAALHRLQPENVHGVGSQVQERSQAPPGDVSPADADGVVERRKKLLDDYKRATGEPSSQRIYEAPNCPIYKPEFYQWKNGSLPDNSRTTKQFEEFLRAKRRPHPKNPTT